VLPETHAFAAYDADVRPGDLTDDELTAQWEAGTVFENGIAHSDHLRITWTLLRRHPREMAFTRLQEGTKRSCDVHGCPEKYSEELTERWSVAIAAAMDEVPRPTTLLELLERHPELRRGGHFGGAERSATASSDRGAQGQDG
jgi:hypothetical protein